jgi:hypothetical protein
VKPTSFAVWIALIFASRDCDAHTFVTILESVS